MRARRQLNRDGIAVARCTVERLMRDLGIRGVTRGRRHVTTIPAAAAACPADLVNRNFTAPAPNRLWVCDLTYVATDTGMCYVSFVIDCFARMIVGWQASRCAQTSRWTRLSKPSGRAGVLASTTSCITPIVAPSTCRSATPSASTRPARSRRSARAATPTTKAWFHTAPPVSMG
ncbi:MAG: DDE-type integrase/transposase/recombinase, partial [Actinobacteria bacterium]|nr:DDE-type integrase/transposase/recombinase [Actinomycetota bacterium]